MDIRQKLLVTEEEALRLLSIPDNDLEWLINTGQLAPIKIRGRRLFEVSQLDQLVAAYKVVQARGTHDENNQRQ